LRLRELARKAIAINDDREKIKDLRSLVAAASTEAKKLFQGKPIRILPTVMYDVHFHSYIFLIEYVPGRREPSFEETMGRLRSKQP
jgi:hypothetical protein